MNTKEAIDMGRARGRKIKTIYDPIKEDSTVNPAKIHTHTTLSQVLSVWDKNEPVVALTIPDAIMIKIFPR